jgi:hypothetical protein
MSSERFNRSGLVLCVRPPSGCRNSVDSLFVMTRSNEVVGIAFTPPSGDATGWLPTKSAKFITDLCRLRNRYTRVTAATHGSGSNLT